MDYRERGSHARGVYPLSHGNSKDEAKGNIRHTNNSYRVVWNMERGHEGEKFQTRPN